MYNYTFNGTVLQEGRARAGTITVSPQGIDFKPLWLERSIAPFRIPVDGMTIELSSDTDPHARFWGSPLRMLLYPILLMIYRANKAGWLIVRYPGGEKMIGVSQAERTCLHIQHMYAMWRLVATDFATANEPAEIQVHP